MTRKQQHVPCDYCGQKAFLTSSREVYGGRDFGPIYLCRPCNAWVGVHRGTPVPLGRLADAELRKWKVRAHAAFDPTWRGKNRSRSKAYAWLANQLQIPASKCHIGMFDIETCKRVISICAAYGFEPVDQQPLKKGNDHV